MAATERRGSQQTGPALGHGRTKSLGGGMGSVPMSPAASGSPMLGAEHEWADIQARWGYHSSKWSSPRADGGGLTGLSVDGLSVLNVVGVEGDLADVL